MAPRGLSRDSGGQGEETPIATLKSPVPVVVYRVTGRQVFFSIPDSLCEECDLTVAVARKAETRLGPEKVIIQVKPWLRHLPEALIKGGWHPPVVTIAGKLFTQGVVPSTDELERAVLAAGGWEDRAR